MPQITTPQLMIFAAAFVLVVSLWLVAVTIYAVRRTERERLIARRLGQIQEGDNTARILRLWRDGKEATTVVPGGFGQLNWWQRLETLPADAGWQVPWRSLVLGLISVSLLVFAATWAFTQTWLLGLAGTTAVIVLFGIYAKFCVAKNETRFERQLADALQLIARSLRAGHPLTGAFRLAAEELPSPISTVFGQICQEQALGVDLEDSLRGAAERSRSADFRLFAASVIIQFHSGGNLADMMTRLAEVIHGRIRLSQRLRVIIAQTQFSKRVLLALPLLMLLILSIFNPKHIEPLVTTTLGQQMLGVGVVAMLLGAWTMNRMARLRY